MDLKELPASFSVEKDRELYRLLFQESQAIMLIIDPATAAIVDANRAAEKFYGFSREELLARRISDINTLTPEEIKSEMAAAAALQKNVFHFRHRLKGGEVRDVEVNSGPIELAGRGLLFSVIHDVTDRLRDIKALHDSERHLYYRKSIAEAFSTIADDEIYATVLDVVLEAAASAVGLFGFIDERGDLVCPSMTAGVWEQCQVAEKSIILPHDRWAGLWGKALLQKRSLVKNQSHQTPPGHIPIGRSMAVPIRHALKVIGLIHVANRDRDYDDRDLLLMESLASAIAPLLHARLSREREERERRRAEEEVRQFKTISDQASHGAAITDLEGRLRYVNAAFANMHGYRPDQVLGWMIRDTHAPRQEDHVTRITDRLAQTGSFAAEEIWRRRADGGVFPTLSSAKVIGNRVGEPTLIAFNVTDISDLKRAEDAIRESEYRYRTLFNNAADAIFIHDLSGRFLEVNSVACERLGYSRDQLLAMSHADLAAPEFAAQVPAQIAQIIQKGSVIIESAHLAQDGRVIPIELSARLIDYAGEKAALSIARDISERKEAEQAIKESMQTSVDIVRAIPTGLFIFRHDAGPQFIFVYGNSDGERISGRTLEQLYGLSLDQLWPRAAQLGLDLAFQKTMETGQIHETEVIFHPGEWLDGVFRVRAFRMARERLGVVFENLTEVHRLSAIAESIGIGVIQLDRERRVNYWNDNLAAILGGTEGQPPEAKLKQLVDQPELKPVIDDLDALARGELRTPPLHRLSLEGKFLECSILPIRDHHDAYQGSLLLVRDVTQDLLNQQDLIHREKMAALGVMVAGIAHDLNNPLGGVKNCIKRIKDHPENLEQTREYLELMDAAVDRMGGVVRQLLRFSRKDKVKFEPVNLAAVLREAAHFAAKGAQRPEVQTQLELAAESQLWIQGDFNSLFNLFLNVYINAYDAIAGPGQIKTRARLEPGGVAVEISDTGPGIDPKLLKRIFDPFFTTKPPGKGTGLGLSIARQVMKDHQGRIEARTQPGRGARFRITVPALAVASTPADDQGVEPK